MTTLADSDANFLTSLEFEPDQNPLIAAASDHRSQCEEFELQDVKLGGDILTLIDLARYEHVNGSWPTYLNQATLEPEQIMQFMMKRPLWPTAVEFVRNGQPACSDTDLDERVTRMRTEAYRVAEHLLDEGRNLPGYEIISTRRDAGRCVYRVQKCG